MNENHEVRDKFWLFKNHDAFKQFSEEEINKLASISKEMHFLPGDFLINSGELPTVMYFVLDGSVSVNKESSDGNKYILTELGEDSIIGEMSYAERLPYSASVIAKTNVDTVAIDTNIIQTDPAFQNINIAMLAYLSAKVADKLLLTDEKIAQFKQDNIENIQMQMDSCMIMLVFFVVSAFFTMIAKLSFTYSTGFSLKTFVVFAILSAFSGMLFIMIKQTNRHFNYFGITTNGIWISLFESIIVSFLLGIAIFVLRNAFINSISNYYSSNVQYIQKLINHPIVLVSTVIFFCFLCFIQELVVRGVLQTTILEFVPGSEQIRTVIAIVASNSLYGLVYAQISARDSLFMCILGIFWGYLYHRQKNIIGVSVSHFLIKSWMFCLGLSSLSI